MPNTWNEIAPFLTSLIYIYFFKFNHINHKLYINPLFTMTEKLTKVILMLLVFKQWAFGGIGHFIALQVMDLIGQLTRSTKFDHAGGSVPTTGWFEVQQLQWQVQEVSTNPV